MVVSPFQRSMLFVGVILLALVLVPVFGSRQTISLVTEMAAVLAIALMWNLLAGFGGIVFMGFQVFIGLGGYAVFIAANGLGVMPFPFLLLSALLCAGAGLAISPILFRLQGVQFAIASWVISEVVRLVIFHTQALGGGGGVSLLAMRSVSRELRQLGTYGCAVLVLMAALLACVLLMRSRIGLALRAIRDNPLAAESMGVDLRQTQRIVLMLSAAIAGAAGGVFYMIALQIGPTTAFSMNWMAITLFVVILGGIGTLEGPIAGVAIYFLMRETLSDLGSVYFILLGLLAIVVTLVFPGGAWGGLRRLLRRDLLPIQRDSGTAGGQRRLAAD
jgi:branched-chain amino acid transport system permease protein